VPFYYIEYAIAQLGALQFYRLYRDNPQKAVDNYLNALSLGGSRGPVDLFSAGGIKFDFSREMLKTLMDMVEEEMENL
jgi:oligoendopeptidase F